MKTKLLAALVAALLTGAVNAGQTATATSAAGVGSLSVTGNIQNGIAAQGTKVSASNTSTASAWRIGPIVGTSANTAGGTTSLSAGFAFGAFGATGGVAGQFGTAAGHSSF